MAHNIVLKASKEYRDKIDSEFKAPRRIIGWVIGFQIVELLILVSLVYKIYGS